MRFLPKLSAQAALSFALAAGATGAGTLALTWISASGFGSGTCSPAATSHGEPVAGGRFASLLATALLTGEECRLIVQQLSAADLRGLLGAQDTAFWRGNPNAALLLRQAAAVLAKASAPAALITELTALLRHAGIESGALRRLVAAALAGALEARDISSAEIVAIMRQAQPADAVALLETWLDFQHPTSPQSDLASALALAAQAFPQADEKLRDDVRAMIVRVWAHRAPAIADALLFAKQMEDFKRGDLEMRLCTEGARLLAVAQPDELRRQLATFGPLWPEQVAQIAADSGISFDQARQLAAGMQEKARDEFLGSFVRSLAAADPREMSKFAAAFAPGDLPPSAANAVAKGLMTTSDFGQMDAWLEGMDAAAQAKLLDQSIPMDFTSGNPSASAYRYYLEKRSASVPPDLGRLNQIAWQTPLEQLDSLQPWLDHLPQDMQSEMQDSINRRQLQAAVALSDESAFALLEKVPERNQKGALDVAFGNWTSPSYDGMQDVGRRWLEQAAGDPKLQARIAEPLVRGSIANADLESAEAMAWGLLDNVSEPDALAPVFDRVVRAATSRDSARGAAVVERLPAGEMRDGILPTFTRQWAELDPAAAADWLAEQPAGAGRDRATRELVACSRDDPESALANAAGIADPKLRLQAARSVLQVWRDVDPAQVAGILPGAGFPPEELPMLRALLGLAPDTAKTPGR